MCCMYVLRSRSFWQGLGTSKPEAGVIARTNMPVGRWLGWEAVLDPWCVCGVLARIRKKRWCQGSQISRTVDSLTAWTVQTHWVSRPR